MGPTLAAYFYHARRACFAQPLLVLAVPAQPYETRDKINIPKMLRFRFTLVLLRKFGSFKSDAWVQRSGNTKIDFFLTRRICDFGCWRRAARKMVNQESKRPAEKIKSRLNQVVLLNQILRDHLSRRIEEAYQLRLPDWRGGCSTSRVWNAAAERLWEAHATDPARVPLDPELFVASQPIAVPLAHPWSGLAGSRAIRRYRSTLRRNINRLRGELKHEVGRAERLIKRGREICEVLKAEGRISALGCFIVAVRAGRGDLAACYAAGAAAQHRSCPLSQQATLALLPTDLYPAQTHFVGHEVEPDLMPRVEKVLLSLN